MRSFFVSFTVILLSVACGTSSGTDPGDGGCIDPVEGTSCSANDVACQPQGNVCCIGYEWACQSGAWTKLGVGCACQAADAGPFACGSATCSGSEYCVDQAPGIALPDGGTPPDSFTCSELPPACEATPTCSCVKANGACAPTQVASCDESNGQVTVHCLGE